jgi:hypothetical protein
MVMRLCPGNPQPAVIWNKEASTPDTRAPGPPRFNTPILELPGVPQCAVFGRNLYVGTTPTPSWRRPHNLDASTRLSDDMKGE